MTRKRSHRRPIVPLPPRGLRPKLAADQVQDLSLVHVANLDTIARGDAGVDVLWQSMGGALTWSRVAIALQAGEQEMAEQLAVLERVAERYRRTGIVRFTGEEYQLAKAGVDVMDQLAEMVDRPTAVAAAEWSERQIARISA